MSGADHVVTRLLVAAAATSALVGAVAGGLPEPWWRYLLPALVLAGAVQAVWRRHVPALFALFVAAASIRLAASQIGTDSGGSSDLTWLATTLDLAIGLGVVGLLAYALHRRQGTFALRDFVDVIGVSLAAALIAWLVVGNPLNAMYGVDAGLAITAAAYLPTALLLATFTIDLFLSGLTENRAMRCVLLAAFANLAAAVASALHMVGSAPVQARPIGATLFIAALLLMAAGIAHPDAPAILVRRRDIHGLVTPVRLVIVALALVTATTLLAAIGPSSAIDTVVRTLLSLALACIVALRLFVALRDHHDAQASLRRQVYLDELTGLPTRTRFNELVDDALETTWRTDQLPSIVQLNLDRFKNINDSLGHIRANRVLQTVAARLDQAARSFGGIAARLGGDDFVVLVSTTTSTTDALEHAADVRNALSAPIDIDESTVFVTASIGVVTAPRNQTIDGDELIRRANIATDRARAEGRNRVVLFDESMQSSLTRRMDVEHALHGAIGRCEMRLYHQPIVDIRTGRVTGFEALIRWQRGDEIVPPMDFIPIAEETGIINELGAWALHEALGELRGWIDDGIVESDATVSVNVSPRQIADPNFADVVGDALERSGMPASSLWLEMTETMMLEEPELAQSTLRRIGAMGVRIALDDFGTGFSSLSLLQQFPIHRLKIDRAFVNGVAETGNDQTLVRTIIAMARSMDLDLVAEGVETVHQLEQLRAMECDKAQGYLISRPVPPDAMRSTMGALAELATLSLFDDEPFVPLPPEPTPVARSIGLSIGNVASRPLGNPQI